MSPRDGRPFLEAGFELQERLHLLSLRLPSPPRSDPFAAGRTTSGRAWHLRRVLEIDQQAFDPFWRFDRRTLTEARRATPVSRYRVAGSRERQGFGRQGRAIVGYAVTGRAGPRGYLQRLAVAPEATGQGYGTMLVNDALDWLAERGANTVMVNTQESNGRALELYRRIGFLSEPEGLVVLSWKRAA
jgi:ribosomal protein S18 acetylase RimI-like enzyme